MKRKRDENESSVEKATGGGQAVASFTDFSLDPRLVQAVAGLGFERPSQVQEKAIPLALQGKDVLAKAPTGSGKTAAYLLPVMHSILKRKQTTAETGTTALILVPTRELADQVFKKFEELSAFCAKEIQAVRLAEKLPEAVQRSLLANSPDIVISTPARAWSNINSSALSVDKLTHLVLDEADLVLSYGYEDELQKISQALQDKGPQCILMSATLGEDVDKLKEMGFCRNPTLLEIEEVQTGEEAVTQFVVKCGEDEKFLLSYILMKLKLVKGKCIIFVANVDRAYRLKLFFQGVGIRSVVLNPELPVNSRIHAIEAYNSNVYDILIASDENEVLGSRDEAEEDQEAEAETAAQANDKDSKSNKESSRPKKKRKAPKQDKEFGVSRGLDFKQVRAVINLDFPTSSKSYTHRIGRTGRAGQTGMALSFVVPKELYRKHMPTTVETAEHDEKILARVVRQQEKQGKTVKDYAFDKKQTDAFRYRVNDCLRAVTQTAIREARIREVRQALLNSSKLSRYFEENPAELRHLRHDTEARGTRTQNHLKNVPEYLLPKDGKKGLGSEEVGFVPFRKEDKKVRGHRKGGKGKPKVFKVGGRKGDPLKTFKARRKTK